MTKQCKNCRFYNGTMCAINNQKKTPNNSCTNWVEYKSN